MQILHFVVPGIARALLQLVVVAVGVTTVLFFVLRLSGDPVALLLPFDATPEDVESVRRQLGLDKPILLQYLIFLSSLARLDFGDSLVLHRPALPIALERFPATIELTLAGVLFGVAAGFALGLVAALRRGTPLSLISAVLTAMGQTMPAFWLGILLILIFSVQLRWLPTFGTGDVSHLVLPGVTLGALLMSKISRLVSAGLVEALDHEYITTARAKGLHESTVVRVHAIPNVLIPIVTVIGLDVGALMGGAIITESVFAWPGVGRQLVDAVMRRDYPLVQASVFLIATFVVVINMTVDLTYRVIDPRLRTE